MRVRASFFRVTAAGGNDLEKAAIEHCSPGVTTISQVFGLSPFSFFVASRIVIRSFSGRLTAFCLFLFVNERPGVG
jgi:hypothetical protein